VRLARALAAIGLVALLQGCGTALVQDDWHAHPTHPALPPHHIELAERDLPRACGEHAGMRVHGCAVRLVAERVCLIYTGPRPAAWLLEHEHKHCAGWDHGPAPVGSGARVAAASPLPGNAHSH
jgi:hypothetical protein